MRTDEAIALEIDFRPRPWQRNAALPEIKILEKERESITISPAPATDDDGDGGGRSGGGVMVIRNI